MTQHLVSGHTFTIGYTATMTLEIAGRTIPLARVEDNRAYPVERVDLPKGKAILTVDGNSQDVNLTRGCVPFEEYIFWKPC